MDLWNWMDGQRKAGNELLAVSQNANLSDGRMFPTEVDTKGRPIDAAYAASRVRNEPLTEIKQLKGASESHPMLSPTTSSPISSSCRSLLGNPPGRIPHIVGSYARQALKDGLVMQDVIAAAFVVQLRAHWGRVAGSWIAASGILMLGWSFRGS